MSSKLSINKKDIQGKGLWEGLILAIILAEVLLLSYNRFWAVGVKFEKLTNNFMGIEAVLKTIEPECDQKQLNITTKMSTFLKEKDKL